MDFRSYREKMGWTLADAAELLGLRDGSTVAKHERGVWMPSFEVLGRYEKLTGGQVTVKDFMAARAQYKAGGQPKSRAAA